MSVKTERETAVMIKVFELRMERRMGGFLAAMARKGSSGVGEFVRQSERFGEIASGGLCV